MSPIQVVELEAALEPFCPVATLGESYHPATCQAKGCTICADLLLRNEEGTA